MSKLYDCYSPSFDVYGNANGKHDGNVSDFLNVYDKSFDMYNQTKSGGAAPPPPPPPPPIGGYNLWFDASNTDNFTFSSGTNISYWLDGSGNNNDVYNLTAYTPIYVADVQNGLGAVYFNGTNNNLECPGGITNACNNQHYTIFVVTKALMSASSTSTIVGFGRGTSSEASYIRQLFYQTAGIDSFRHYHAGSLYQGAVDASAANCLTAVMNGVGVSLKLFANTTEIYSGLPAAGQANVFNRFVFGCALYSDGELMPYNFYKGYIMEFLLYPTNISSVDITATQDYLIAKWGI